MTITTIIKATESLIAKVNSNYAEFAAKDKTSTAFHVRSSIYFNNYSVVYGETQYLKVINSFGTKFFVNISSGDIYKVHENNSFFCTPLGNVLEKDFGYSTFNFIDGVLEFKSDVK